MTVARFIADQRTLHRVPHAATCRLLGVSESCFYKWVGRAGPGELSVSETRRRQLDEAVRVAFEKAKGTHGSPRLLADLREAGWTVSEKTVAASMRRQGLVARRIRRAIVAEAQANQTDGYRMVCAFVRRRLGIAVNPKRVLRVMREHKLVQRRRPLKRRKRPGFFRVKRPRQLWQLDMTSVWTGKHGWCYLMAIIDCLTREIVGFKLDLRCRADEAIAVVEHAAKRYGISPGELVLGTDNGSAFTARRFRAKLAELGIHHRRGGYRDPESQAFIESWFGKLKEREVWLNEYETLDDARAGISTYVDRYHQRPHSGLAYPTPTEVARTWQDEGLHKPAT
jgi:putative transposase